MMTFYLGIEVALYKKKFQTLKEHFRKDAPGSSNAAIFRHIVDILYTEIERVNTKNNKKEE